MVFFLAKLRHTNVGYKSYLSSSTAHNPRFLSPLHIKHYNYDFMTADWLSSHQEASFLMCVGPWT